MKEGTGDDPFADDPPAEPEEAEELEAAEAEDPDESEPAEIEESVATATEASEESAPESTPTPAQTQYPYFLLRDTVKEGRTNEHVYFLRDEYAAREREVHDAVEERLGEEVYLTDLREALVATADPEAIAEQLEEWGQGIK